MKNLIIVCIFFMSCNNEKATPIVVNNLESAERDSMLSKADSTNEGLKDVLSDLYETKQQVRANINKLKKENEILRMNVDQPVAMYMDKKEDYRDDDKDKTISDLRNELMAYKAENVRLRNKLYSDSVFMSKQNKINTDKVEEPIDKPGQNSLVITLNRRMRGDGDISETGVNLYIMPFNKQSKKLMNYTISCDMSKITSLEARQANYYNGQYFFNDVKPGKYLIKVCAYYGNYMVIKREKEGFQMVAMQISPPIQ